MRHPAVEDDRALHALTHRFDAVLDLRDHAIGYRAVGDPFAHLGQRQRGNQALVLIEDPGTSVSISSRVAFSAPATAAATVSALML